MKAIAERIGAAFADPNPILVKELRATFRTALFVRFLYLCTGLVALLVLGVGASVASGDVPPATVGQVVFQLYMGTALLVLSLVAPGYASSSITSEREQQTWESLELSGMSPWRIVLGKFAACYASIALVLIALSPVVGIAFLFGGVSPWQVVIGFFSLLLVLAPSIAVGVAISARLGSTRLAIVLATVVYFPLSLGATGAMTAFGDVARTSWGTSTAGPFFYTEALVTRAGEWDTWAFLVGVPLYAYGMPVWFLLASAVAGVRPAAEDRARALKIWAVAMTLASAIVAAVCVLAQTNAHDAAEMALVSTMASCPLFLFYGLLFSNEPPLPPRPWETRRATLPAWRRALGVFGPGAAGTLRFAVALNVFTGIAIFGAAVGTRYLAFGALTRDFDEALGAAIVATGAALVGSFTAAIGGWLRIALRHGLAARVLNLSILMALALLPLLVALVIDPNSMNDLDDRSPFVVRFSIIEPILNAIQVVDGPDENVVGMLFPLLFYGALTAACWVGVEVRVRQARREAERRRARFAAEAEG